MQVRYAAHTAVHRFSGPTDAGPGLLDAAVGIAVHGFAAYCAFLIA